MSGCRGRGFHAVAPQGFGAVEREIGLVHQASHAVVRRFPDAGADTDGDFADVRVVDAYDGELVGVLEEEYNDDCE